MDTSHRCVAPEQTGSTDTDRVLFILVLTFASEHNLLSCSSQVCSSRLHIGHAGVDNQVCYMRNPINMVSSAVSMEPCREEEKQLMPAVNQNQCRGAENVTALLSDSRGDCCSRCCCCSSSSFSPNLDLVRVLLSDDVII